jgi:hypothetical protein
MVRSFKDRIVSVLLEELPFALIIVSNIVRCICCERDKAYHMAGLSIGKHGSEEKEIPDTLHTV